MSIWGTVFSLEGNPPYAYQESHILPAEDSPRDGVVQLAEVPSHITRDGRDDRPEDGVPWPWLRLSVDQADVVLDREQVREMWESMGAWLEQVQPEGPPHLTAAEAREEVDRLATELYYAQDAHAFVGEMCDLYERKQDAPEGYATLLTADVREWLKGPRCVRLLAVDGSMVPDRGPEDRTGQVLDALRVRVREALETSGRSQASIARELEVSTKHLNQMLMGRAVLSLEWAERILRACGMRLIVGEGER